MEEQILKEVCMMLENSIYECKCRKDKRVLKDILAYVESHFSAKEYCAQSASEEYSFDVGM